VVEHLEVQVELVAVEMVQQVQVHVEQVMLIQVVVEVVLEWEVQVQTHQLILEVQELSL
jgi:hypothetical protein